MSDFLYIILILVYIIYIMQNFYKIYNEKAKYYGNEDYSFKDFKEDFQQSLKIPFIRLKWKFDRYFFYRQIDDFCSGLFTYEEFLEQAKKGNYELHEKKSKIRRIILICIIAIILFLI